MPVIKIFYDEMLDNEMRAGRAGIQVKLEAMMREVLIADPANCQVILCSAMQVSPLPVYVDMQFRANDHRTHAVVTLAMERIAAVIADVTGTGIRIRAFDIDQSHLHALDRYEGEAP